MAVVIQFEDRELYFLFALESVVSFVALIKAFRPVGHGVFRCPRFLRSTLRSGFAGVATNSPD